MSNKILRAVLLVFLLTSLLSQGQPARAAPLLPPVDMFQLPWELGKAWVAYDGFGRSATSAHNSANGGAVDFAPHPNMQKGEDTSNAWVTAAAAGTVVTISSCHLIIAHANGWLTEYQHLTNFQVTLGSVVVRNQKLAVIANASASQPVCLGSVETDTPHLHFALRPNMVGATFAGWEFRYNTLFKTTTFVKDGNSLGLFVPLLNVMGTSNTPTVTPTVGTPASTPTMTPPSGPYVSTTVDTTTIPSGGITLVTVRLNNVPVQGYNSGEFTCSYNASILEAGNITIASLFGADSASAVSGPQNGQFIVAIAGSKGNKATTSGVVFTFTVKGLAAGLSSIQCSARVSQGTSVLTDLPSVGTSVTVAALTSSSTPSPPTATAINSPTATLSVPPTITSTETVFPTTTFTPTATGSPIPTFTSTPAVSPTPTVTDIPIQTFTPLPTATAISGAAVTGQVIASKVVTVRLYDLNDTFVASVNANPDGTFRLDVAAGTYTIVATANGFLRIQGTIALAGGETRAMPVIALLAGDIDDDGSIDQFDALTIAFSYGTSEPPGADLNNDGIINVLDLDLLADNYRKTGPVLWQ